ncbi:AAA family ATPase [Pseudonocardia sp. WMMC193]|nr:MinD/ParA family protein [Pseudonocardia sp. WMMC193]MCF7552950.1 AAA family ATPase [Pseudonocardia sp. WMMC193]
MSDSRPDEYPDGSVGRYVRERWAANARAAQERREQQPGIGARRDEAWGVVPDDATWGSDVLEIDEQDGAEEPPAQAPQAYTPPPQEPVHPGPVPPQEDRSEWFQAPEPTSSTPPVSPAAPPPAAVPPPAVPPPVEPAVPDRDVTSTPARPYRLPATEDTAETPDDATPPDGVPAPQRPIRDVGRWTDPGAVAAQEAQRHRADSSDESADLSTARLLRPSRRRPPRTGWRKFLYLLTGRLINPGESPQDIRERELISRINQPLLGCHKIATLSLKGGVGKTTITATLGATFASKRGDRVVAVDANPDRGTLAQKIPLETSATVRHLLRDAQRVRRYTDVRAYTSQGPSRLEVLASEEDPAVSEAFSEDDYRRTVTLLEHFYNIVLTDCGTGLMHSAMYGVLGVADQLIIVSSGSIDGARSASATMDWLEAHDHGDLVRNGIAVINNVHRQAGAVDLDQVARHFAGRCRAVVQIPFDPHLEEGAEVDLDRLSAPTRIALLELAAYVADGFPR